MTECNKIANYKLKSVASIPETLLNKIGKKVYICEVCITDITDIKKCTIVRTGDKCPSTDKYHFDVLCEACSVPSYKTVTCYNCKTSINPEIIDSSVLKVLGVSGIIMLPFCNDQCLSTFMNVKLKKLRTTSKNVDYKIKVCPCYKFTDCTLEF